MNPNHEKVNGKQSAEYGCLVAACKHPISGLRAAAQYRAAGKRHGIHSRAIYKAPPERPTSPISWLLSGNLNKSSTTLIIPIPYRDQKNIHLRKHVGFKSRSVGASADVSLFKHKWDPSLIPVTVPDEKHNLTSTFLISSQILSLIYTNTSIYQEHCLKKLAVTIDQRGNVNHCYCQSVDLCRHYSDFWMSQNVFLSCQPCFKLAVPVFCQTSSVSVVIGRIGPLFPHRLNLSL